MATKNDKLVLNTIFNPFEPNLDLDDEQPDDGACPVHPNGPDQSGYPLEKLKKIELEGIKLAEEGEPVDSAHSPQNVVYVCGLL